MPPKIVSSFRAPTAYEEEMLRAKRQQQLAEMLRQQAFVQDEEPFTFQGFRAMPSPAGALSRVLQAYAAKKVGEKAEQAETRAREADVAEFEALRRDLGPQTQVTGPDMFADPMQMASKYTPPVTQTVMLTPEEREERLVQAMATGGPRAQRYAELMLSREPKAEEFYAPTETADGQLVQFGRGGGKRETGYKAPTKPMAGSSLSKLIAERDALPLNSPMRVMYDNAIAKETSNAPLIGKIDLGDKGSLLGQELYLKKIDSLEAPARNAGRILNQVNAMDKATQKGTFTGSMAPTAIGAAQFLDSFGVKVQPEVLANTRAFQAASNQLVLDFMAANGGARGFTEKETAILQDAFPKIIDSPQARQQIADLLRNRALQDVEDYNFAIGEFGKTFPNVVTPYKPIDNEEIRYQRWRRSQGGG